LTAAETKYVAVPNSPVVSAAVLGERARSKIRISKELQEYKDMRDMSEAGIFKNITSPSPKKKLTTRLDYNPDVTHFNKFRSKYLSPSIGKQAIKLPELGKGRASTELGGYLLASGQKQKAKNVNEFMARRNTQAVEEHQVHLTMDQHEIQHQNLVRSN